MRELNDWAVFEAFEDDMAGSACITMKIAAKSSYFDVT